MARVMKQDMPTRNPSAEPGEMGRRSYNSQPILDRRQRILDEAKAMMAEAGAQDFTIRDLGRRAEVSVTTIYKAFGDKETVIAHALRDFYQSLHVTLPAAPDDLIGYLNVLYRTSLDILRNPAYCIRLTDLYFSRSLAPALYEVIKSLPLQVFSPWIEDAQARDQLRHGIDIEEIKTLFANIEWANMMDWATGRVSDHNLAILRQKNFLLLVRMIGDEPLSGRADTLMRNIEFTRPD